MDVPQDDFRPDVFPAPPVPDARPAGDGAATGPADAPAPFPPRFRSRADRCGAPPSSPAPAGSTSRPRGARSRFPLPASRFPVRHVSGIGVKALPPVGFLAAPLVAVPVRYPVFGAVRGEPRDRRTLGAQLAGPAGFGVPAAPAPITNRLPRVPATDQSRAPCIVHRRPHRPRNVIGARTTRRR